ncbi:hypothetical protein M011DRAFT_528815 [Sporormia fimetaria CBS 119925]|uniref:Uncharacterized protein n=1 Tax=Sporormia fimetaria CBS 119925 TaxID=1340428 RepID=A0A6A6V2N4_9PLEO|nr:hypothetical protein M011DRAFT_528815 [Sporormia fimetaria CBS 119925]
MDPNPGTPKLVLEMKPSRTIDSTLSLTLPYSIDFTIHRADDNDKRPMVLSWIPFLEAFVDSQLILLHITEHGPEKVEVPPLPVVRVREQDRIEIHSHTPYLWELSPGDEARTRGSLTGNYQRLMEPGEKYELLWPGAEISMWDWGSKKEHFGQELRVKHLRDDPLPALFLLPGTTPISFTAKEEREPWPGRPQVNSDWDYQEANSKEADWRREQDRLRNPPPSPPPRQESERVSGAPILSMQIECPSEWAKNDTVILTIKVTYKGVSGDDKPKPITFRVQAFENGDGYREGIRMYRRQNDGWINCPGDDSIGWAIFEGDPIPVAVGDESGSYSDQFVSLRPGESWSTRHRVQYGPHESRHLPDDAQVGERFKYVVKGAVVDWWDWGMRSDHLNTVVKLPVWMAGVVEEPKDNGGRPKIIVPRSNEVEFTYVG